MDREPWGDETAEPWDPGADSGEYEGWRDRAGAEDEEWDPDDENDERRDDEDSHA